VPQTFALAFVPGVTPAKWVGVWRERMRHVPIELLPLPEAEALQALLDGTATVALLREPFDHDGLHVIPLYEERAVVVAPKDHAIAAVDELSRADLAGETVLDHEAALAVELVAANVGVAIMPQSLARLHHRRDVVARPLTDEPTTRIALAWLTANDSELVEEFIGIVRGRTANSSRGAVQQQPKPAKHPRQAKPKPASKPRRR
jgi:DNA-binding transcriptional LysR family regulator